MSTISEVALYGVSVPIVRTYAGTLLRTDVVKHFEIPQGPKIIAANHPSTADPFFVASMIHQRSFIMIEELMFQVPILGAYLRQSGHICIQHGNNARAMESALAHLKAGQTVVIFPEGLISPREGGFNPAHTGVARLALASGAPVIPVGIAIQRERIHHITSIVRGEKQVGHWYLSGPYAMTVGRPLQFTGDADDRTLTRSVADQTMRRIIEMATESELRINRTLGMAAGLFDLI
jgi:1-acyl-sn-glycerol-3-phosphate acyltransferase